VLVIEIPAKVDLIYLYCHNANIIYNPSKNERSCADKPPATTLLGTDGREGGLTIGCNGGELIRGAGPGNDDPPNPLNDNNAPAGGDDTDVLSTFSGGRCIFDIEVSPKRSPSGGAPGGGKASSGGDGTDGHLPLLAAAFSSKLNVLV
jgi:hypothetical protein